MTQTEFIEAMAGELRSRSLAVTHGEVKAFAVKVWPLVPEKLNMAEWADTFLGDEQRNRAPTD